MSKSSVLDAVDIVREHGQGAGKVRALKGVSLSIMPGELTLLMGPSGSGKTTLLSILGCILAPTSGRLRVAGHDTEGLGPEDLAVLRRENIGFVFQSYNLFPTLTALENVRLALDVRGHTNEAAKKLSVEALRAVGLSHRLDAYPRTMSGGEQQRVAIARALAGSPAFILADEPTSALDAENGLAVMELIRELSRDESRAVLAVTHDHRTLAYADRIITIEDGLIMNDRRPGRDLHDESGMTGKSGKRAKKRSN